MNKAMPRDFGDMLLADGALSADDLARARLLEAERREPLDAILSRLGLVADAALYAAIAAHHGVALIDETDFPAQPVLVDDINVQFLREERVLPLAADGQSVRLAMADPGNRYAIDAIELVAGAPVEVGVASGRAIEQAIERLYRADAGDGAVAGRPARREDRERLDDAGSQAPAIRFLDHLLDVAVAARASDIHIEPRRDGAPPRIRLRIDGLLQAHEAEAPPAAMLLGRLKVMSRLNLAERRLPQDGKLRAVAAGREIDLRLSTMPTIHGEAAVLRLLDRERTPLDLAGLGFPGDSVARLRELGEAGEGMIAVVGPTGSGKTTTLYALLQELSRPERKIVTVEDPVELDLPGTEQVQVAPEIGLDFARVLRSTLRHDPDVILLGEIRDRETAEVAVQSALTGHQVLTTLHTGRAARAVSRLLDLGIEDFLLADSLRAVLAQRLVRTLCPDCREPGEAEPALAGRLGFATGQTIFRPAGCPACHGSGYRGRLAVGEFMPVTAAIRALILEGADAARLEAASREAGWPGLREAALAAVSAGRTSLEEAYRVIGSEGDA